MFLHSSTLEWDKYYHLHVTATTYSPVAMELNPHLILCLAINWQKVDQPTSTIATDIREKIMLK